MDYTFKGPSMSIYQVGLSFLGAACVGGIYAIAKELPTERAALPFSFLVIRELADRVLYNFLSLGLKEDKNARKCAEIYALTNLSVNIVTLVAFYRNQLIGKIGVIVCSAFITFEMLCKVTDFPRYRAKKLG